MVQTKNNQHHEQHVIVSKNQAITPSSAGSGSNVVVMTTDNDDDDVDDPFPAEDTSYTRYAHYPPYCSTPQEMEKRAIPPLSNNNNDIIPTTQLVHVTALIRHGSRTPFAGSPSYKCWNGYWDTPNTGIWNCDLKTYMSPPATSKEKHEIDREGNLIEEEPDFLFEKRYDALLSSSSSETTGNILNGTCQMGQLLAKGYEQELRNGKHLRQAYFYDGENTVDGKHAAADPRMRLWDLTKQQQGGGGGGAEGRSVVGDETKAIYQEPNLRYRAGDEQRTLMSGQILLRGLFGPELLAGTGDNDDDETAVIKLHTADYTVDVLTPNGNICPRVAELRNEAYESDEYRKWIETSLEVKTVNTFMEKMGLDTVPEDILDCMMTTICTDRKLPDVLNDWVSEGDGGMFDRVANFAVKNFTFPYKYNDGAYSKVGMGPLWLEIMSNILQIVDPGNHPSSSLGTSPPPPPPPKLALFSGHDTTLMPILATLGDNVWSGAEWSPYASMLQFEIHQVLDTDERFPSGYAFRLIYNGNVLTSKMDGCPESSDLCDAQVLVRQVMSFANKYEDASCATKNQERMESKIGEMKHATDNLINTPGGILVICFVVLISMALGGIITCILMRRRFRKEYKYTDTLALTELSMSALDDDYDGNSSAVSPGYETTSPKKIDENSLI